MRSATARLMLRQARPLQAGISDHTPPIPDRRAVTLVELVIVVLIMGILAAAATPTFYDSLVYHRVETAARRVKVDLQRLRQTARLTSRSQSITFHDSTAYTLSGDVVDPDHPDQAYTVDLSEPPFQLDQVTIDFSGDTSVSFDGYGTPSRGGTIVLAAGNYACKLALDGTTGQITRSDTTSAEELGL